MQTLLNVATVRAGNECVANICGKRTGKIAFGKNSQANADGIFTVSVVAIFAARNRGNVA